MSNCKKNDTIIDPFCGTGGILIEAGSMKLNLIGLDILEKMVDYTEGNLKHFGLKAIVKVSDVKDVSKFKFDAIVCDPPYGISTTTKGENIGKLMSRTMKSFSDCLQKGKRLIMAISNPLLIPNEGFIVKKRFEWYIHKSLTRHLLVLEKS